MKHRFSIDGSDGQILLRHNRVIKPDSELSSSMSDIYCSRMGIKTMSVKVFSQEFATLLKTNNETIKSVSETLDIPFSTLQRYSKGEVSNLNIDYIERVAEHFDVPISRLLGKKDISPDSRLLNEAYNQSRIAYEERLNEKKKTIHFCRWVISLQTVLIIALVAFIFYVLLVDAQDGASGIIRYTLCR